MIIASSVHKAREAKYFMHALDDFILIVLGCICNLSQNRRIAHQPTSIGGEQICQTCNRYQKRKIVCGISWWCICA